MGWLVANYLTRLAAEQSQEGGTAPIFSADGATVFSNPLPQVLILTAIVVGISTTALGLGIVVRVKEEYGSIEEHEIQETDER